MNRMNLRPAFMYRFKDSLKSAYIFYGIMVILTAAMIIGYITLTRRFGVHESTSSFSAYGFAANIVLFVCGIVCIREDLRIGIQHGCSRRTAFVSNLLALALISLILAVAGEVLNAVAQAVASRHQGLYIADIYQITFTDWQIEGMTFSQHLMSILINFILMVFYSAVGVLVSLVFYRLNKTWTIVVAIGVPVFLFIILPIFGHYFIPRALILLVKNLMVWVTENAWNLVLVSFIGIVILTVINWLLLRRAPIKAAKK